MTAEAPNFACQACGRKFKWSPRWGGRKTRCKCGQVLSIPSSPPRASASAAPPPPSALQTEPSAATIPPSRASALAAMIAGGMLLLLGLWQLFDPLDPQSTNVRDRAILVALGWVHAIAGDVGLAMVLLTCALLLIGLGASRWRRGKRAPI